MRDSVDPKYPANFPYCLACLCAFFSLILSWSVEAAPASQEGFKAFIASFRATALQNGIRPDVYDRVIMGGNTFEFPSGRERLREQLKRYFPKEASATDCYIEAVLSTQKAADLYFAEKAIPRPLAWLATARTGTKTAEKSPPVFWSERLQIRWCRIWHSAYRPPSCPRQKWPLLGHPRGP